MSIVFGVACSQVDELRTLHETEHRRRVELERALRDAAAMFKTELFEKQVRLCSLRKALICAGHALARMQGSARAGVCQACLGLHSYSPVEAPGRIRMLDIGLNT